MLFNAHEKQLIFALVRELIGSEKVAENQAAIFLSNVKRRILLTKKSGLKSYLNFAYKNPTEFGELISALSIHTTHWFREARHFERIMDIVNRGEFSGKFCIASIGCSTGEEAYSAALTLENYRTRVDGSFDYEIEGFDIDPVSIRCAQKGVYSKSALSQIPLNLQKFVSSGSGPAKDYFAVKKAIRSRVNFSVGNILSSDLALGKRFDLIVCRNILIYFKPDQIEKIFAGFERMLAPRGAVILGHSEALLDDSTKFSKLGNTVYQKKDSSKKNIDADEKFNYLFYAREEVDYRGLENVLIKVNPFFRGARNLHRLQSIQNSEKPSIVVFRADELTDSEWHWLTHEAKVMLGLRCCIVGEHSGRFLDKIDRDSDLREMVTTQKMTTDSKTLYAKVQHFVEKSESSLRAIKATEPKDQQKARASSKILIVEDDIDVREAYEEMVRNMGYQIDLAENGNEGEQLAVSFDYDLVLSDLVMPQMNGLEMFRKIRKLKPDLPGILITGFGDRMIFDTAQNAGFATVLDKPLSADTLENAIEETLAESRERTTTTSDVRKKGKLSINTGAIHLPDVILLGASTGGTEALLKLLEGLGDEFPQVPPVIVVQHIPHVFARPFAERLAENSGLILGEVHNSTKIEKNHLYVGIDDKHIELSKGKNGLQLRSVDGDMVFSHRPSVENLFKSAAEIRGKHFFAALLTGMGKDGAMGLASLKYKGAFTAIQDERSSVVYGMPKEAALLDGHCFEGNLQEIRSMLSKHLGKQKKKSA